MRQPLLRSAASTLLVLNLVACAEVTQAPKALKTTTLLIKDGPSLVRKGVKPSAKLLRTVQQQLERDPHLLEKVAHRPQALQGGLALKLVEPPPRPIQDVGRFVRRLEDVRSPRKLVFQLVSAREKKFADGFKRGADHPENFLKALQQRPELKEWFAAPKENRIFMIGQHADEPSIRLFQQQQKARGFHVYFYKSCTPLCRDEEVGAMAASAGEHLVFDSMNAQLSKFIYLEILQAKAALGLNRPLQLIVVNDLPPEFIEAIRHDVPKAMRYSWTLKQVCDNLTLFEGC